MTHLARLDGHALLLADVGVVLASACAVRDVLPLLAHLCSPKGSAEGALTQRLIEQCVKLDSPLCIVDRELLASAHHDLRTLSLEPARELASENRRALARFGQIDDDWLAKKRERVDQISALHTQWMDAKKGDYDVRAKEQWFESIIELVRALRGDEEASRLSEISARIQARPSERRREAMDRVAALVNALTTGIAPEDAELADLAATLDSASDFPGRARRRRTLDVLRRAVRWSEAPANLVESIGSVAPSKSSSSYEALVLDAGNAMAAALPILRDPSVRERTLELLAHLALLFPIGEHGVPSFTEDDAARISKNLRALTELAPCGVTLAQAIELAKIPMKQPTRCRIAEWVAEGLDIDLVALTAENKHIENLVRVNDMRSARAYATWATRLSAHYQAQGVAFTLSPELFTHLPKNEDLGVLAMCLMEQADSSKKTAAASATAPGAKSDPIAVLDATLALFQRLPKTAKNILGRLRETKAGAGRKLYRDFAEWLDDDALLDRMIHIATLAGESPLSSTIREDFEHAERTRGERAHLEKLTTRSVPQQGRLDVLLVSRSPFEGSHQKRTRRRIAERTERLLPIAYRRELDATFREILNDAWGIKVPALTPAWRDAVRFLLVADENRGTLTHVLKKAAHFPGTDVKRGAPKNEAWITSVKDRMNVDAWLRPRRREFEIDVDGSAGAGGDAQQQQRYVIELEEDPLEVLRMGIPFGTCLSLENGVNAAATVYNAFEVNKRVLYVRQAASKKVSERGSVVARKLLAISKDDKLIGYNLYVSVRGAAEIAIRKAVLAECHALAKDVGIPLAATGEPQTIHKGFWYDDGTVPFEEDMDVSAYCRSIALPPPPKWFEDIGREARAWRACETGDVEAAIPVLSAYDMGPANRALGAWLVDRLGTRAMEKRAAVDSSVFVALGRSFATEDGEDGIVRTFDLALRLPDHITNHRIWPLIARFPPSLKIAAGLCDMGVRSIKRFPKPSDHGLAHFTMTELPLMLDDVASSFDLLDGIEPAWQHVAKSIPECASCAENAAIRSSNIVESIFARAPNPDVDVVLACLMNRHRSVTAQRAALRVAASHVLPNGSRALVRFASLRPKLAASPLGIAALLRQANVDRVTESLARKMPRVTDASAFFDAMRDLVRIENLGLILDDDGGIRIRDVEAWTPASWELAWRRRNRDESLHRRLFDCAAQSPYRATRAMELLAYLGDLERIKAIPHAHVEKRKAKNKAKPAPKKALHLETVAACMKTATSLAAQIRADSTHRVVPGVSVLPHADGLYVARAVETLLDDSDDAVDAETRAQAQLVIRECTDRTTLGWRTLLMTFARRRDHQAVISILDTKIGAGALQPAAIVDVWQLPEARDSLAALMERVSNSAWAANVWAAEREASARGLSVDGLLEKVALALVSTKDANAVDVESFDQLRSIATAIVNEASPENIAAAYGRVTDALSAAVFVRAVKRLPVDRAAAIREAVKKMTADSDLKRALVAWMESTRGSRGSSSSATSSTRASATDLQNVEASSID